MLHFDVEQCDFFKFAKEPCHKLSYNRIAEILDFKKYSQEEQEVYLWRAGGSYASTICLHHAAYYGTKFLYTRSGSQCCNVFQNHGKSIRG